MLGLASVAVAPWAPLPVAKETASAPRVHAAAPVLLGLVGLMMFVETAAFEVPLAPAIANAALIMVASTLVPIPPLDGSYLSKAGLLTGAGLVGAAVLTGLALM